MMRLHPTATLYVLVALLSLMAELRSGGGSLAAQNLPEPPPIPRNRAEECRVVKAVLADTLERMQKSNRPKRPIALLSDPVGTIDSYPLAKALSEGRIDPDERNNPIFPLRLAIEGRDGESVLAACPETVASLVRDSGLLISDDNPATLDDEGYDPVVTVGLSMPAISADGKQALIMSAECFAPDDAIGLLLYLEKDANNAWRVRDGRRRWVS